ncbi:MAG: hypothetical protein LKE40_11720 [Spirochaetia bacterium]|jgi:protein-tyrosine phosphatase|nr:hypothetical protein [Spirochaetia bacterium]
MYRDIHTHLLPGIEGGSVTKEQLPSIFSAYIRCHISSITFTPHLFNPYVHTDVPNILNVYGYCKSLAEDFGISCYLGSEIFVKDAEKDIQGIPIDDKYYLLEFPIMHEPEHLLQKIEHVVENRRNVIIAHVERYPWLTWNNDLFKSLKELGVLFQCNAGNIDQPRTKEYLSRDLIDLLASNNQGSTEDPIQLVLAFSRYPEIAQKTARLFL